MKYRLLTAKTPEELEEKTNKYLNDGWGLHGPTFSTGNRVYCGGIPSYNISFSQELAQAVVKENDA